MSGADHQPATAGESARVAADRVIGVQGRNPAAIWVWDEWNNLNVEHIIIAIFTVGIVGLMLEQALMLLARRFEYRPVSRTSISRSSACSAQSSRKRNSGRAR